MLQLNPFTEIPKINSKDDFNVFVQTIENQSEYKKPAVFAIGIATVEDTKILEAYYPLINVNENHGTAAILSAITGRSSDNDTYILTHTDIRLLYNAFESFRNDGNSHPNIDIIDSLHGDLDSFNTCIKVPIVTFIEDLNESPTSTTEAYLRLQMISRRQAKPNSINLDGLFSLLPNIAWTSDGPMTPERANKRILSARLEKKYLQVFSVDKFPRMTDYFIPSEVRIADATRVRLGAYVGEGVTFMHEGFCNFNAGAEGPNMIEGRISQGVFIKKDTDLGGGSATMGTLSGGGKEKITVGIGCLLGSNSVLGISLGDFCTLEAGLAVMPGAKVRIYPEYDPRGKGSIYGITYARELSGKSGLQFRRSSTDGHIEVLHQKNAVELNEILHSKQ